MEDNNQNNLDFIRNNINNTDYANEQNVEQINDSVNIDNSQVNENVQVNADKSKKGFSSIFKKISKERALIIGLVVVSVICVITSTIAIITINQNRQLEEENAELKRKRDNYMDLNAFLKPVIYLYPEEETIIDVRLGSPEKLTCIYPEYNDGWSVVAEPNGTLKANDREYYSLYYECDNIIKYDHLYEGFVVAKNDITKFLEEKLEILGLNNREAEEMIIYWLPKLEEYNYVYFRFETMEELEEYMPLEINPAPDTLIRIMMEWKGLDEQIEVQEQILTPVVRNGYTVVEWGGTELD
jgi:hypothetical protein